MIVTRYIRYFTYFVLFNSADRNETQTRQFTKNCCIKGSTPSLSFGQRLTDWQRHGKVSAWGQSSGVAWHSKGCCR